MATALGDLERWAVQSPRAFLAGRNCQNSIFDGTRTLRCSWNFPDVSHGLTLDVRRLKQHEQHRRRIIFRAKKEGGSDGVLRKNRGPDVKFDSMDMMELEFGRLLGEDRQTTLSKVFGKKLNPELTYIKIEKEKELRERRESARRSSPSKIPTTVRPDFTLKGKASDYTKALEPGVPDLTSPPIRPPGFEKIDASPVRTIRVAPLVRSGGGKKSVDADPYELQGLVRKPVRVSEAEKGLPPARPERSVITPVLMKRKENSPVDIQPKPEVSLLRRPSVRSNALGERLISDHSPASTFTEEVQSADDIDPSEMSEERFGQLLDGELNLKGVQKIISRISVSKKVLPPLSRPVLTNLEEKPSILGKSQLVESRENLTSEPANSTSSAGAEGGLGLQGAKAPSPRPILPSKPKTKLLKPPHVREETNPQVINIVNDVLSGVNVDHTADKVKADDVISLEERTLKIQIAKESVDNTSGKDPEDDREGLTNSVVRFETEDTLVGNIDVQGSSKKESTSAVVARVPVMRLRKTSLPLQQPALSKDDRYLVDSGEGTSSPQDIHVGDQETLAPDCASENEGGQGINEAQQGVELESMVPKTRQPVPSLKLSRPASPPAFTSKKAAQVDTTLNTLQKAISSFDERRNTPNKKENDEDWARAEASRDSKAIEELEIIGTGRGGLLVGFGSLVGYLPAFELKAERRSVSFTVWAQSKGYDAKTNKYPEHKGNQNIGGFTTTSMESATSSIAQDTRGIVDALEQRSSQSVDPEVLEQFKKERAAALSSLVGQKAKVMVISVDRTLRQLRISEKQAEGEQELSQKKIILMESLNVGDVVTCQVKKITAFGAFVDLQGVPALIHNSELSWNRNTDPLSVLQVGQEVKAKVCKLDRFLQRINLSLKLMQPDPLLETLESLVSPDVDMASASADVQMEENEELNSFMRKLEQIPEIAAVRRGRRVRGAALAPAFQIYLSAPLDNGYKLLARFGNEVQEVLAETSADRERMKDFIRDCTVQDK